MLRSCALLLLLAYSVVESRVDFTNSVVLDSQDFKGTSTISLRCSNGCRVFSPTRNGDIVILDDKGNTLKSLLDLSNMNTGYELAASKNNYQLRNKGNANPKFVFYSVTKEAANYNTRVVYVYGDETSTTISAKDDEIVTVMSDSGSIGISNFQGDYSDALPSVYTSGFDAISSCTAVYTASSASSVLNTFFTLWSPMATFNFKKSGVEKSVVVTGKYDSKRSTVLDSSAVYVSPGFACNNMDKILYSLHPVFGGIDSKYSLSDSNVIRVKAAGELSTYDYAITLKINNDQMIMKNVGQSITKTVTSTKFDISFNWMYITSSSSPSGFRDKFAIQIDNTPTVVSTTPMTTTSTTPVSTGSTSTKSVQHVDMLSAFILTAFFIFAQ